METPSTTMRLSQEARDLADKLAARLGLKRTAVVEMAIRKLADAEGLRSKPTSRN